MSQLISIELKNFQSIRDSGRIELAPLTLLFGPNSAGKSALLDAIDFGGGFADSKINQWRRRENGVAQSCELSFEIKPNPDSMLFCMENLNASVRRKAWWILLSGIFSESNISAETAEAVASGSIQDYYEFMAEIHIYTLKCCYLFSDFLQENKMNIYIDDLIFAKDMELIVYSEFDIKTNVLAINKKHPKYSFVKAYFLHAMQCDIDDFYNQDSSCDEWLVTTIYFEYDCSREGTIYTSLKFHDMHGRVLHPAEFAFFSVVYSGTRKAVEAACKYYNSSPVRSVPSGDSLSFECNKDNIIDVYFGNKDQVSLGKTRAQEREIWRSLSNSYARAFLFREYEEEEDSRADFELEVINKINEILTSDDYLASKYKINFTSTISIPTDSIIKKGLCIITRNQLADHTVRVNLQIEDVHSNIVLDFDEIGVGLSQVLPILIALLKIEKVHIQQPELHLHPALQTRLGDVFVGVANKKLIDHDCGLHGNSQSCIVETHSEHLLLRILKRIRQTSQGNVVSHLELTPKDVAVYYFNPLPEGYTKVKRLRVAENGEFLDRWPNGFFEERDAEFFDNE